MVAEGGSGGIKFLLVAGQPIGEPIVQVCPLSRRSCITAASWSTWSAVLPDLTSRNGHHCDSLVLCSVCM